MVLPVQERAESLAVPVPGGDLHVLRWGTGTPVLGLHGITASAVGLSPVAANLDDGFSLVAPDLRGRGRSAGLPGPYGMAAHADDCAAVLRAVTDEPAVVIGESMGAYVAVHLAHRHPELVSRLVLVDGGLPAHLPQAAGSPDALEAILGPVVGRLRQTYPSREDYLAPWRAHPSLAGYWSPHVEAYLDYEMQPCEGGFRSVTSEAAVREDFAQNLQASQDLETALRGLTCPVTLLRAERNIMNQLPPILPDEVVDRWRADIPQLVDEVVPDSNHYTIMFDEAQASHAARAATAP